MSGLAGVIHDLKDGSQAKAISCGPVDSSIVLSNGRESVSRKAKGHHRSRRQVASGFHSMWEVGLAPCSLPNPLEGGLFAEHAALLPWLPSIGEDTPSQSNLDDL